jgi:hypothetical protein
MFKLTDRSKATAIAKSFLDFEASDPDCDECILARHFLRALEQIEALEKELGKSEDALRAMGELFDEDD